MSSNAKLRALAAWACPLVWWTATYLSAIAAGDPTLRLIGKRINEPSLGYPGVVSALAVVLAAVVLEVLLLRGWSCEWVSSIVYVRWLMYAFAFVVGLLLWSGTTTSYDVPLAYRAAVIGTVILPLIALVLSHSMTSHWEFSESGASRSLRWLGRGPLILFMMIMLALWVLAIVEKFFV